MSGPASSEQPSTGIQPQTVVGSVVGSVRDSVVESVGETSSKAQSEQFGRQNRFRDATDADLVFATCQTDRAAFDCLHQRYERVVRSVVRGEGTARADVDDVVQEAFTLAWRRIESLQDPARFRPWLLQITRRVVIDHARRLKRRPILDSDDDTTLGLLPSSFANPEEIAELSDLAGRLSIGIDGLSRRDATAITLAVSFGFGPLEIAEALGTTPGAAKVVLHRARKRLRSLAGIGDIEAPLSSEVGR